LKANTRVERDKKEAVSLVKPVLLHRDGVGCNEAINRLFELRITRKCLLLVIFDAYYRELYIETELTFERFLLYSNSHSPDIFAVLQ